MTIEHFTGDERWLSNFWLCDIDFEGVTYPSTEHAYMASKTLDPIERAAILACDTCAKARRLGQSVTLRPGWELPYVSYEGWSSDEGMIMPHPLKVEMMWRHVRKKFFRHEELGDRLLATGDHHLVENSSRWNDRFWGVSNGRGQNNLGRVLMTVREELRIHRAAQHVG